MLICFFMSKAKPQAPYEAIFCQVSKIPFMTFNQGKRRLELIDSSYSCLGAKDNLQDNTE